VTIDAYLAQDVLDRQAHALTSAELAPLHRWIAERILPGGFLTCVLKNDLRQALARADVKNRRRLFEYVQFLSQEAPSACWGSEDKVNAWQNRE
jgi:hypothetical protein